LLEFGEHVIEESAFTGPVGAFEDIDPVLPKSPPERGDMPEKPVYEKAVSKKWMVGSIFKQATAIIADIVYGFGIVGVFVYALANVAVDHVVEHLKDVSEDAIRRFGGEIKVLRKTEQRASFPFFYLVTEVGH